MLYRDFSSQEELDEQYDLRRSVADPTPFRELYGEKSEEARSSLECALDVRFGPTLDEHLDIFPAAPGAPILVFIHGGYWRASSSKNYSLVALGPSRRRVMVVVTNYSLCPKVTIDEITRQSRAALAWLWQHAQDYGGDPERIYVAGHSAGAQQAAMLLGTSWQEEYGLPDDLVKGALGISGIYDLRPLCYTFLQPKLQLTHQTVMRQSPLFNLPKKSSPLLVSVGADEPAEFLRQSRDFLSAWTTGGLEGGYFEQAGKNHYSAIEGFLDCESALCQALFKLMKLS